MGSFISSHWGATMNTAIGRTPFGLASLKILPHIFSHFGPVSSPDLDVAGTRKWLQHNRVHHPWQPNDRGTRQYIPPSRPDWGGLWLFPMHTPREWKH